MCIRTTGFSYLSEILLIVYSAFLQILNGLPLIVLSAIYYMRVLAEAIKDVQCFFIALLYATNSNLKQ